MSPAPSLNRPLVMAAVIASFFMIAIEATIVSTAMPQIAGQLGDLHLYAWVFAAFLLTQTAMTVVFGKLSDLFGRKPVLLTGVAIFLIGSLLCGFAWSMPSMIVFRLIQGVGAGAIQPVGMTIVGDLYSPQERGKIQGYLASVWGISSVIGPLVGGLVLQHWSWAWIFWMNLPIGLLSALGFIAFLHERSTPQARSIDIQGAALFTLAVGALMFALTEAAQDVATAGIAAVVFVVAAVLFVLQERRAQDPMVDFRLWGRRVLASANGASLLAGMAVIGLTSFLPMYVQGVLRQSALVAGFALTMMVLGWPIGATLAAKGFGRFGLRQTLVAGAMLIPLGAVAFLLLVPVSSPVLAGCGSLVMGFGMGLFSTAALTLVQDSVGWSQRGSATASNIFSRNLGSTLGATVFGAVLNYGLLHSGGEIVSSEQLRHLLDAGDLSDRDSVVRVVLQDSLHLTFWAVFVIGLGAAALALLVPESAPARTQEAAAE